ncbi:MAG TPA: O-antigen ligase family protein [Thermoguttaceae bacterium]|nr:O-antigen ligase family protein [Thermoguttaceae bacterium]
MGKAMLILAFSSAGLNFVALRIGNAIGIESPMFLNVALCVPAAAMGAASWLLTRSFARAWPVVLCVLLTWIGMLYAFEIEKNRGTLAASYTAMALPIGALIVQHRCWWLCAKVYVIANAVALAVALWFEYQAFGSNIANVAFRFGWLWSEDGMRRSNPNVVGGQLAFAALLAFMLYLREDKPQEAVDRGESDNSDVAGAKRFSLGWTFFLTVGVLLTASRGAFLAWSAGLGVVWFWGSRATDLAKLRNLVAVSILLLTAMLFTSVAVGFAPWTTLQKRIEVSADRALAPTARLSLWRTAFKTWWYEPEYFLFGTGTGVAPEVLGEFCGYFMEDGVTVAASNTHNGFVEWGLSFGLLGIVVGTCMLVAMWRRAFTLDHQHASVNRRAILLCFSLISMYYVTFYQLLFVAAGALILAMLSEPPDEDSDAKHIEQEVRAHNIRRDRPPMVDPRSPRLAMPHANPRQPVDAAIAARASIRQKGVVHDHS